MFWYYLYKLTIHVMLTFMLFVVLDGLYHQIGEIISEFGVTTDERG